MGLSLFAAVLGASVVLVTPSGAQELLTDGNFEQRGYLDGWQTSAQAGSAGVVSPSHAGWGTPYSGFSTVSDPRSGYSYAVFDSINPAAEALGQSFTVPSDAVSVVLSFQMFVNNYASGTIVNDTGMLDYTASPNQYARVDILKAGSDLLSTAPEDIVTNLYISGGSTKSPLPFSDYSFNLSGKVTPGSNYILRFGEVASESFQNVGVDNVSLRAQIAAVPEPATWAMMIVGFGLAGFALRRRAQVEARLSTLRS